METLPIEIIRKIKLFCVYNPVAEMIRKKREIYSLDDTTLDEMFIDNNLWAHWVLKFENYLPYYIKFSEIELEYLYALME